MLFSFRMNMPLHLMAYYGSFAIVVALLLRVLLKRALPKPVFSALWVLVMVRLLVPFSISSPLSLSVPIFPSLKPPAALEMRHGSSGNTMTITPTQSYAQIDWSAIVAVVFCVGVAVTVAVLLLQKRYYDKRLRDSLPLTENQMVNDTLREMGMEKIPVFTCDSIRTPLVHGLLHPRIYMPTKMDFTESKLMRHILLHELIHIRQKHNWLKTAMLVVLCLNWYNPLVWVMAYCMGADLESACDAAVIKRTGGGERHDYAKSLLAMAMTERRPALIYSSFAKTEVECRIKGVLRYRRATMFGMVVSALMMGMCAVAMVTIGQAEFSPKLSSSHQTSSGRWRLRGEITWNVPLGENPQERADKIIEQLLSKDITDDIDQIEKQLQAALSKEFGAPEAAFSLQAQRTGTEENFDAEYAASGVTKNERGRYVYEGELVRMMDDPVRSFGATNPLGTVDLVVERNSTGGIAAMVPYREGSVVYEENTKKFPG